MGKRKERTKSDEGKVHQSPDQARKEQDSEASSEMKEITERQHKKRGTNKLLYLPVIFVTIGFFVLMIGGIYQAYHTFHRVDIERLLINFGRQMDPFSSILEGSNGGGEEEEEKEFSVPIPTSKRESKIDVWNRQKPIFNGTAGPGMIKVLWSAPFWAGGGYSSEAIAIMKSMYKAPETFQLAPEVLEKVREAMKNHEPFEHLVEPPKLTKPEMEFYLRHFADNWNWKFVKTLPPTLMDFLMERSASHSFFLDIAPGEAEASLGKPLPVSLENSRHNYQSKKREKHRRGRINEIVTKIVICHSEPGAWSTDVPLYNAGSECPPEVPLEAPKGDFYYLIGRTMFETDRLPKGWAQRCNHMDEVWVPSEYQRDLFLRSGVEQGKLKVVPVSLLSSFLSLIDESKEPVDTHFFSPSNATRIPLKPLVADLLGDSSRSPDDSKMTKFLSIFKWEDRKGWDILVRSYLTEFFTLDPKERDNVGLFILTNPFHLSRRQKRMNESPFLFPIKEIAKEFLAERGLIELTTDAPELVDPGSTTAIFQEIDFSLLPPIFVLENNLPMEQLPSLYKSADAFVLPSRGEGWGRPYQEAMSMGMITIATNHSGNLAFQNPDNSLLISVEKLEEIPSGPFKGHLWAKPSQSHLQELMRKVVQNPRQFDGVRKQARRDMRIHYSLENYQDIFHRHFLRIHKQNYNDAISWKQSQKVRSTVTVEETSSLEL